MPYKIETINVLEIIADIIFFHMFIHCCVIPTASLFYSRNIMLWNLGQYCLRDAYLANMNMTVLKTKAISSGPYLLATQIWCTVHSTSCNASFRSINLHVYNFWSSMPSDVLVSLHATKAVSTVRTISSLLTGYCFHRASRNSRVVVLKYSREPCILTWCHVH